MARVKGGNVFKNRRRKVLKEAKGYFGSKHRLYKSAQEQVMHSGAYSYQDRKKRTGDFRKLWITRINAACRLNDISYSKFISGLNKAGIQINRKMLSELAISDAAEFSKIVALAKAALEGKVSKKAEVKKEEKTTTEVVKEESTDLSKLTVAELKELAKEKHITVKAGMKKADIIELLNK